MAFRNGKLSQYLGSRNKNGKRMIVIHRWYRCGHTFWIKLTDRASKRVCGQWVGPV